MQAVLCLALAAGCGRGSGERREMRDRHLRRAFAAKESQDIDRAIELCEKALERKPDLALAHRELGLMLDNYRGDYVEAIYHYQRYLELRPDSEQREAVEKLIRHCRASFAAEIAETPAELERTLLERNERIRQLEAEVAEWRAKSGVPAAPLVSSPAPVPSAATPALPTPVHVVQAGENLATISSRYYGTPSKWQAIFNANRDRVADANNIRVGTRLDIPAE